jgi:hypothetical protein
MSSEKSNTNPGITRRDVFIATGAMAATAVTNTQR